MMKLQPGNTLLSNGRTIDEQEAYTYVKQENVLMWIEIIRQGIEILERHHGEKHQKISTTYSYSDVDYRQYWKERGQKILTILKHTDYPESSDYVILQNHEIYLMDVHGGTLNSRRIEINLVNYWDIRAICREVMDTISQLRIHPERPLKGGFNTFDSLYDIRGWRCRANINQGYYRDHHHPSAPVRENVIKETRLEAVRQYDPPPEAPPAPIIVKKSLLERLFG